MKTINVVAAVIIKNNLVFATQRGYGEFKDGWEFPGGKIEKDETPIEALKREIKEELNALIEIDEYLLTVEYDYPNFHLSMQVFICHLIDPHLELLEHESAKWVKIENLDNVDFLPADKKVVAAIKRKYNYF